MDVSTSHAHMFVIHSRELIIDVSTSHACMFVIH